MQITTEDVRGWISIILTSVVSLVTGLFGLWKIFERKVNATAIAIRREHEKDFDELRIRIAEIAEESNKAIGRLEMQERRTDLIMQDRDDIHEDFGELKSSVQQLVNKLNDDKLNMKDVLNSIDNRLTRIETKLEK